MAHSKKKLGRQKEAAIIALLSQRGIEEVARACNTPPRTLYRWLKEPEFDAAYRAARRTVYGQSIARLQQASTAATTTLLDIMNDPETSGSTRVRAAESVLTHAAKSIELEDLQARISDLERAAIENDKEKAPNQTNPT